jgi:hypothetical protein
MYSGRHWLQVLSYAAIFAAAFFGMGWCSARAQTEKQIEYGMLNEWRKEIVRLQYTDFCASVKLPSPQMMQILQSVIAQGKEAKHPVADEMEAFFGRIAEQYKTKGCGDV